MNLSSLKRLIVVEGKTSSGKTAILMDVCRKLKAANPTSIPKYEERVGNDDCRLVMVGAGGRMTAVSTAGDDANCIMKSFILAELHQCEVLVMAVSEPAQSQTYPLAKTTFQEVVTANSLKPIVFRTTKTRPARARGYIDLSVVQQVIAAI